MALETIGAALAAALAGTTGVSRFHWPPPEQLGPLPAGVLYPEDGEVTMGSSEMWTYGLLAVVYVARANNLPAEMTACIPFIERMAARLRQAITLGGTTHGVSAVGWDIGQRSFAEVPYVTAALRLSVKQKYSVSYTG